MKRSKKKKREPRLEMVPMEKIAMPGFRVAIARFFLGIDRDPTILKWLVLKGGHLSMQATDDRLATRLPQSWLRWENFAVSNGVPPDLASKSIRLLSEVNPAFLVRVDPLIPDHQLATVGILWTPIEAIRAACARLRGEIDPDPLDGTRRLDSRVIQDAAEVLIEVCKGDSNIRHSVELIHRFGMQKAGDVNRISRSEVSKAVVVLEGILPDVSGFNSSDFDRWEMSLTEYQRLIGPYQAHGQS